MTTFNPDNPGIANGNYFGLPYSVQEAEIALVSVPWDATTSYRAGTHDGPKAMIDASLQIDLFDPIVPRAWEAKIGTVAVDPAVEKRNRTARRYAERVISHLEKGEDIEKIKGILEKVNRASDELNEMVYTMCKEQMESGRITGVVGGDHSVPFGNIKAVSEKYEDFGILHIDAHADLRIAYEGFKYSHASIMYNTLKEITQVSQLTQVAVRDLSQGEANLIDSDPRIRCFTDYEIRKSAFDGKIWKQQCEDIIATLPKDVYISFDIDGLSPELCPNTGTPVPGGLSFREVDYLLCLLATSNRNIIGFDLCEVSPSATDEWDANVGARILFKLALYTKLNSNKNNIKEK